jgi:single-stranded-DNA-specific exonuclease
MEPFGPDNLNPTFLVRNVLDTGWSKIVKEAHLRFVVQQQGIRFSGIGFNMAEKLPVVKSGQPFDMVFKIEDNEWNGEKGLQLKVLDIRAAS